MLSFGLTLLGGCVATTETGLPSELYFPTHSVRTKYITNCLRRYSPIPANDDNMAASAHSGVFIAENVTKTGKRSSIEIWGILSDTREDGWVYDSSFFLGLCAKHGTASTNYATNINWSPKREAGKYIALIPSLYTSGMALQSPRFILNLENSILRITDSFSGTEHTQSIALNDDLSHQHNAVKIVYWTTDAGAAFDFVVNAYRNDLLAVNQLTLPLRTLPHSFGQGELAAFEFQTGTLIEL